MIIRTSRILVEVVVGACVVMVLGLAAGAWRLSQGPVSIDFLTPHIREALNAGTGDFTVDFDDTQVVWAGWERALDLRATNLTMRASNGRLIARVPQVSVGFSVSALLRGVLAPKTLDVITPQIRLVRRESGALDLGFGPDSGGSGTEFATLFESILASREDREHSGYLEHVAIIDATVRVEDRKIGATWSATGVDATLRRVQGALAMRIDASLALGAAQAHAAGDVTYLMDNGRIVASLQLTGLNPPDLAKRVPALSAFANLAVPFDGSVALTLDETGSVLTGEGSFHGGSGVIKVPDLLPDGLAITGLDIEASYASDPRQITVDSMRLDLGDATIELTGTATSLDKVTSLKAEIVARDVPFGKLGHYWPKRITPPVRNWVLANMTDGVVREARARLFARAAPDDWRNIALDTIKGSLRLDHATIHYLRPMPPITNVAATAAFDNETLRFKVTSGRYRDLSVPEGRIDIEHLDRLPQTLGLAITVKGPLRTALELLDHERLGYISPLGIDPKRITGTATTKLSLTFPLVAKLKGGMVDYRAQAKIEDAALPAAVRGLNASDGKLSLSIDRSGMLIEGTGRLAGKQTQLSWSRSFDPSVTTASRYFVATTLDTRMQRALGVEFSDWIDGPLDVQLDYKEVAKDRGEVAVRIGLDRARVRFDLAGWSKPPGVPGVVNATGIIENRELVEIRDLDLRSKGLRVAGNVALAADRQVRRANLTTLQISETRVSLSLSQRADHGYDIAISGDAVDARPLIHYLGPHEDSGPSSVPPISLAGRVDRLVLGTGTVLEHADVTADVADERLTFLKLRGTFGAKAKISADLTTDRGVQTFRARSSDAGRTLDALSLTGDIEGGKLVVTADRADKPDAVWRGRLHVGTFRLVRAPAFARLLSLASLEGISSLLRDKGIEFSQVDVPFRFSRDEVTVDDAQAVGSQIGLTMKGRVDRRANAIEVEGTIVPAYTINSLLGHIPLIGRLVTGAKGGGVFAATYRIKGTLDEPELTVNPLAALAPGLLRKLISGFSPDDVPPTEEEPEWNWSD